MSQARSQPSLPQAWLSAAVVLVVLLGLLAPPIAWLTWDSWPGAVLTILATAGLVTLFRRLLARLADED